MVEVQAEQKKNLKLNQNFLSLQIENKKNKLAADQIANKLFYKPHFGPEETQELL